MINIDNCPLCNNKWVEVLPPYEHGGAVRIHCDSCKIRLNKFAGYPITVIRKVGEYNVAWFVESNRCGAIMLSVANSEPIDLPWLPYDISIDKLKTLLNFI